ncbi:MULTISPECIES: L,D-transpeptidase [Nitrosomonas]|uniref:Peptidase n=1 Tax=Nitrosomonas communis TaxID=44574 RepID=A0A0F7KIU8_9PROT|nr:MULTISPECIES: L,D-transpeptidase [Nitrosomonas]AKH38777.1 peptidase [Nitrosomonas communis]TYP94237.1 L,D-transpeptidase-like protein [Nitrosomonas communis]UVS60877.1 L,D-transpeptidase [Nitrosomonas sp. PLL12]
MRIHISIARQQLNLINDENKIVRSYLISSARNGNGQQRGSFCTPLGKHIIRAKIGDKQPINTVFVKRRPTGEIYTPELAARYPGRDWILTRIMWLSGCEIGFNRLGLVDTMRRYIYIHGSPDSAEMGRPGSIGCIRMHNGDLLDLFNRVIVGTPIEINQ